MDAFAFTFDISSFLSGQMGYIRPTCGSLEVSPPKPGLRHIVVPIQRAGGHDEPMLFLMLSLLTFGRHFSPLVSSSAKEYHFSYMP